MEDIEYVAGDCPKCARVAWYEQEDTLLWKVCMCGYRKVMYSVSVEGIVVRHVDQSKKLRLPDKETKLRACLIALARIGEGSTKEVSEVTKVDTSTTATQLAILSCKGLVDKTEDLKGVSGGSRWALTETAKELLRIRRE